MTLARLIEQHSEAEEAMSALWSRTWGVRMPPQGADAAEFQRLSAEVGRLIEAVEAAAAKQGAKLQVVSRTLRPAPVKSTAVH